MCGASLRILRAGVWLEERGRSKETQQSGRIRVREFSLGQEDLERQAGLTLLKRVLQRELLSRVRKPNRKKCAAGIRVWGRGPKMTAELCSGSLIVHFMCQHGWATVPRYLVKHSSRCFCKVFLWTKLAFKSVSFEVKQISLHNVGGHHLIS